MKKCIVLDLDGTLLNDKGFISEKDINTLEKNGDKFIFIIASGRHYRDVASCLAFFKTMKPSFVVCSDGVRTYNKNGLEAQNNTNFLNRFDLDIILKIVTKGPVFLICEEENYICREGIIRRIKRVITKKGIKPLLKTNEQILIEKIRVPVSALLNENVKKLESFFSVHRVFNNYYDIKKKGVSKYAAIKQICNDNSIGDDDVYYFGDDMNDIECFENFKHCIAMKNACCEIKDKAEFITLSNNDSGVSFAIENHIIGLV